MEKIKQLIAKEAEEENYRKRSTRLGMTDWGR